MKTLSTSGDPRPVLVTGATGYIGGRLVPRLLAQGYRVRCLARSPRKLADRDWIDHPSLEIVQGDVGDGESLESVLRGCGSAYDLVHSMLASGHESRERDLELASVFSQHAAAASLERIIYLGGLGEAGLSLSEHLASRRDDCETG